MMKKSKNDAEGALFSPLNTTDDDDDVEFAADGGPAPRYRDDPQSSSGDTTTPIRSSSASANDDGGPAIRYRDEPDSSIFDWNDSDDNNNGRDKKKKQELWDSLQKPDNVDNIGDVYQIDNEFDTDANGFSPVSLHDDDSDDDDEEIGSGRKVRVKANNLLNQRVFDDTTYDDENERIFVGGGWGRQGSSDRMWFSWCCRRATPTYSRGRKEGYSTFQIACLIISFLALVFGSGFVGYEAGLPVDDGVENNDSSGDVYEPPLHPHTKGEEWLEWIEHEKDEIHMPHFNMTFHKPHLKPKKKDKDDEKTPRFEPMTQPALLKLSENIFQSCSERSLKTAAGRNACLSLCHGRYCCFEKDVEFGSCVAETNSYCFAYAACENAITDFEMNNANTVSNGHEMNEDDVALLSDTCSKENIATLDGIRDCTAFCQHHLCCFNELESENCKASHPGECAVYDVCKILVDGPDGNDGGDDVESIVNTQTFIDNTQTFKSQCSADTIEFNRDVCKNHCARYECCFSAKDSCYAKQKLECDEYYICEEFYMDYNDLPGPEQDDMEMDGQDQPETSPFVADMDIVSAVDSVCNGNQADESWVSACHSLCANYLCCFATEGTRSNCRDSMGEEMCNAYQGCNVLHITYVTDSEGNVFEQDAEGNIFFTSTASPLDDYSWTAATTASQSLPKASGGGQKTAAELDELEEKQLNEVYEACIPKARRDPWLSDRCRKACDVRGCCFDEGPGNCYGMNTAWCDEFQSCQDVLYD